jgi:hypothetical protein
MFYTHCGAQFKLPINPLCPSRFTKQQQPSSSPINIILHYLQRTISSSISTFQSKHVRRAIITEIRDGTQNQQVMGDIYMRRKKDVNSQQKILELLL